MPIISKEVSYLLLSVYDKGVLRCASYHKDKNQEFIISILTGEKFYSVREFVQNIKGLSYTDETDCCYYDDDAKSWFPLYFLDE